MDAISGSAKSNTSKLRKTLAAWLDALDIKRGVENFSLGLPPGSFRSCAICANRVFWIPAGLPNGRSMHIASSRLGRQPELKPTWFDALRTVCVQMQRDDQFLISACGTASHAYVMRAAQLFHIPVVIFHPFHQPPTPTWLEKTGQELAKAGVLEKSIYFSEPLDANVHAGVDDLLISAASDLRLLSVRAGGNVSRATMNRLKGDLNESSKPWLLVDSILTPDPVQENLIAAGVCAWWLYDEFEVSPQTADFVTGNPGIVPIEDFNLDDYLLHWTRRNHGPWPGETVAKYLDDLILDAPAAKHDRLSTLCRIIATRRLVASKQLTRDSTPVVCFSAVKADELCQLRTFRSHVGRWDFETIGIAIRKSLLKKLGGRPVIYGDQTTWVSLDPSDRPYFQIRQSVSKSGIVDWTREHEWRVVGDVDLGQFKPDDAFLFVSSESEAQEIAKYSRWPVVKLPSQ